MLFVLYKCRAHLIVVSSFVKNSFCPPNIHDVTICCLIVYFSLGVVFLIVSRIKEDFVEPPN